MFGEAIYVKSGQGNIITVTKVQSPKVVQKCEFIRSGCNGIIALIRERHILGVFDLISSVLRLSVYKTKCLTWLTLCLTWLMRYRNVRTMYTNLFRLGAFESNWQQWQNQRLQRTHARSLNFWTHAWTKHCLKWTSILQCVNSAMCQK